MKAMPAAWATWSAVCRQVVSWAAARPRSAATTAPAAITTTEESAAATNAASSRQASGPQFRSPVTAQAQAIADPVHRLDDRRAEVMQEVGCLYLSFLGGGCTLLSQAVKQVVEVGWTDMLTHYRLVRLKVEGLGPATVGIDAHGRSRLAPDPIALPFPESA